MAAEQQVWLDPMQFALTERKWITTRIPLEQGQLQTQRITTQYAGKR